MVGKCVMNQTIESFLKWTNILNLHTRESSCPTQARLHMWLYPVSQSNDHDNATAWEGVIMCPLKLSFCYGLPLLMSVVRAQIDAFEFSIHHAYLLASRKFRKCRFVFDSQNQNSSSANTLVALVRTCAWGCRRACLHQTCVKLRRSSHYDPGTIAI